MLSDYNMELTWITLGWVTGGGKGLGMAMWLLVPRGQVWSGVAIDLPQTLDIREKYKVAALLIAIS
jgi:hypothetical protein